MNVDAIHAAAPTPLEVAERLHLEVSRGSRRDRVRCLCPWHSEKHPSCDITVRDGRIVAICRSCGEGGDLLSLVGAVHGLDARRDFVEVARLAAEIVGVRLDEERHAPKRQRDPMVTLAGLIDYLAERWTDGKDILAIYPRTGELTESAKRIVAEIDEAGAGACAEALAILGEADERRREEEEEMDRRLDAVGDRLFGAGSHA